MACTETIAGKYSTGYFHRDPAENTVQIRFQILMERIRINLFTEESPAK